MPLSFIVSNYKVFQIKSFDEKLFFLSFLYMSISLIRSNIFSEKIYVLLIFSLNSKYLLIFINIFHGLAY